MIKQLPDCEEADDVDIRQWILADDCDDGHQMYTDNNIVSLILSEKSGQDESNESYSDEVTTEVIAHTGIGSVGTRSAVCRAAQ
jgi:hypothetical protein